MPSLRRRFSLGTGLLLGFQILTSGLVLASWLSVVRVSDQSEALSRWRLAVLDYGAAVREQYVHQAHSFVEGGPGHLDHYAHTAEEAEARLAALHGIPVPEGSRLLASLQADHAAYTRWFDAVARPGLTVGIDREQAVALHSASEARVLDIEADVAALLSAVEGAQAEEAARLKRALRRALLASVALALVALGVQGRTAARLAGAVIGPLVQLSEAARRFGAGDRSARAERGGDDELDALARSFNQMFGAVADAEERRVRAERLAVLGELSAAIAHELNNPLTVILGVTDDPTVRREAEHATRVVRGLLGFSRPGEEPSGAVDLVEVAREAVSRHGPRADAVEATLTLSVSGALSVTMSPSAARQILDNLILNAIDAAAAAGPGQTVEVEVCDAAVRVLDRGAGLPAAIRARLYEPFVTGRAGGTGLGLAVCQRVARAQGGQLQHEDRPGGGTIAAWTPGVARE